MKNYLQKTITVLLALAVVVLLIIMGNRPAETQVSILENESITIGAILPMTGDFAFAGELFERGIKLAIENANDIDIKVIIEDDKSLQIPAAVSAANKLITIDKADIILNSVMTTIKSVSSILNDNQVPGILIWDSDEEIQKFDDYAFATGYSTTLAGEFMAEYVYEDLGLRKASVISGINDWSEIIAVAFASRFEELGGSIDLHERIDLEETNVRTIIAKVQQQESEALYLPLFLSSLGSSIKQSRELGFEGLLLSPDGFTEVDVENLGALAEGIYTTQAWVEDESFKRQYVEKFGGDVDSVNLALTALAYDATNQVIEVARKLKAAGRAITPQNIQQGLEEFPYSGITGETDFSDLHYVNKKHPILQVQNGKFVLIKE